MFAEERVVARSGLDGVAVKPKTMDVARALDLPFDVVTVDWEGRDHLPAMAVLAELARTKTVRVTAPVRADGFDPLGNDSLYDALPDGVEYVFVAGHSAYLDGPEQARSIAPRLGAITERFPGGWVGTEGIERIALATGCTQFELLSRKTARAMNAIRSSGYRGELAVYAPTVLSGDDDEILDAVGGYVSRRRPVARALSDDTPTDATAVGGDREVLLAAARDYALVGDLDAVREQVQALKNTGVDHVVGYPARGFDAFSA